MTQPTTNLRPIRQSDNQQLAKLIRDVMSEYGCVGPGYSINDPEVDEMFESYSRSRHAFWVIESDDRILGGGGIGSLPGATDTVCELKKMYFYPELRGQGWGKDLINLCLSEARKFGYLTCYLETVDRMEAAISLYLKTGFKKLDRQLGDTGHCGCDAYYSISLDQN